MTSSLTIYTIDGDVRFETPINIGSKRVFKLMSDDYVTLKFSVAAPVYFQLGDYCDIPDFGRFELITPYQPAYNTSTGGYDYELKLEAQHMKWRNKILHFMPNIGGSEVTWQLTATADVHLDMVLANIAVLSNPDNPTSAEATNPGYLYNGVDKWERFIDASVEASAKSISYDQINIIDALTAIAEAYECEWWITGNTICLGKCENSNDYVTLEIGDNVAEMTRSDSREDYVTRIIPFGSERNISPRYRKDLIFDVKSVSQNGNRISDTARPLSTEWFTDAALTLTQEAASTKFATINNYQDLVGGVAHIDGYGDMLIGTTERNTGIAKKGYWTAQLESFKPLITYIHHLGLVVATGVKVSVKGINRSTRESFYKAIAESWQEPGNRATFTNESFYLDSDIESFTVVVDFYIRYWSAEGGWAQVAYAPDARYYQIILKAQNPVYRISGLNIEKIDSKGNTIATYSNAIFNPDYASPETLRNWIQLPAGVSMHTGDRFRITNINRNKVKSSYFTSRYALYEDSVNVIKNGIVTSRLTLPESFGLPYLDVKPEMYMEEGVEDVVIFDDIYPRALCTVTAVETGEADEDETNDDGTTSTKKFTIFTVSDDLFSSGRYEFKEEYMLEGVDLQVTFQDGKRYKEGDTIPDGKKAGDLINDESGKLNGWTFGVIMRKDSDSSKVRWEIKRDDSAYIPNEFIKPEVGDQFVLHGFDIACINEQLVYKAEQELLERAQLYLEKINVDPSTYSCKIMADRAYAGLQLKLGDRINLINEAYIPTSTDDNGKRWGRKSRVIGYEINLDIPYDNPIYTVGEQPQYSRFGAIEDELDALKFAMAKPNNGGSSSGGGYTASQIRDMIADYGKENFLSRVADDIAGGKITFQQGLVAIAMATFEQGLQSKGLAAFKEGAQFGDFFSSIYAGTGAGIDKAGNAEFESVRVRSYLEAMELVLNRLSAIEGDQVLTEADTIESFEANDDGTYDLQLRSKWDGYFTAQAEGNVLRGIVNTLAAGSGSYYTSWMRVNSVNASANRINVSLYPGDEVPAGQNFPPCEMMKIARWGNQTDTTRQSCLYLSSTDGRITKLSGVTKPIIDKSNYGATFGSIPDWIKAEGLPLIEGQDYMYARGIVVQDILRMDYQGRPIPTYVDRGAWSATTDYFCGAVNPITGVYETSEVWYMGCKYRCMRSGTHAAPSWASTDWAMIEGNPEFTVDFAEAEYLFDPDNFATTLTIVARLYNMDITEDIRDADVEWTRYSEDADGVERVASDNLWAISHAGAGKSVELTREDIDFNGYVPRTVRFTAKVTLRDGAGEAVADDEASFEL